MEVGAGWFTGLPVAPFRAARSVKAVIAGLERYPITWISNIAGPGQGRCFEFRREGGSTGIFEEGEGGETDDTWKAACCSAAQG